LPKHGIETILPSMRKNTFRFPDLAQHKAVRMRVVALLACMMVAATAEVPEDGAKWIEELTAAHDMHEGYISTYTFKAEKKQLEAKLAIDFASGLVAVHILAETVGEELFDSKQWITADDVVFIDVNGERSRMSGVRKEMTRTLKELSELSALLKNGDKVEIPSNDEFSWQPNFLMESDGISMGLGVATKHSPPWKSAVKDAAVHGFDDGSVTFQTKEHGRLTISREHGLLLRQTVKAKDGVDRVLDLKELLKNPGRDDVLALTSEWSTDGAKELDSTMMAEAFGAFRLLAFQAIVNAVSDGSLTTENVDEWLRLHRESLRKIITPWVMRGPQYVEGAEIWKPLLEKVETSVESVLWDKGEDLEGGDAVKRSLREKTTRERVRGPVTDTLATEAEYRNRVLREIFPGSTLQADDKTGRKARDLILDSLTKAYLEAIFDLKANEAWGAFEENAQ
jgi:hypothetical protein